MPTCSTFSQSSLPGCPARSVSTTSRIVMFVQGVEAVHLNSATVVFVLGIRLRWLVLPRMCSKEILVNSVLVLPFASLHGKGQSGMQWRISYTSVSVWCSQQESAERMAGRISQ